MVGSPLSTNSSPDLIVGAVLQFGSVLQPSNVVEHSSAAKLLTLGKVSVCPSNSGVVTVPLALKLKFVSSILPPEGLPYPDFVEKVREYGVLAAYAKSTVIFLVILLIVVLLSEPDAVYVAPSLGVMVSVHGFLCEASECLFLSSL